MYKNVLKTVGIVSLILLGLLAYNALFSPKIAYVDIQKVFNSFQMKKEMQQKFEKIKVVRKNIIDSLSFDLQLLSHKLQDDKGDKDLNYRFEVKRNEIFKRQKGFEEDNQRLSDQYDKQILEQLTQYILDYGKEKHYSIIYGTNGSGTIMYADEKFNISSEVIEYINNKYQGLE